MNFKFTKLDRTHWPFIPEEARPRWCEDTKGIVALDEEFNLASVCIMDSWAFNSVQVHFWCPNPFVLRHGFLEEIAQYIFITCNKGVIVGVTPADNEKSIKFNEHIGLEEICRIPDGYKEGVDYVITHMRRENCRWLVQPRLNEVLNG